MVINSVVVAPVWRRVSSRKSVYWRRTSLAWELISVRGSICYSVGNARKLAKHWSRSWQKLTWKLTMWRGTRDSLTDYRRTSLCLRRRRMMSASWAFKSKMSWLRYRSIKRRSNELISTWPSRRPERTKRPSRLELTRWIVAWWA